MPILCDGGEMAFKLLSRLLVRLTWILLAFVTVELGLSLHAAIDRYQSQVRSEPSGKTRVLLIGDSVLDGPHSRFGRFLNDALAARRPGAFQVTALTQSGLSSGDVEANIQQTIAEYHPQISILLLGRSDIVSSHHPDAPASKVLELYERISHLRSIRLFWMIFDELQTAWGRAESVVKSKLQWSHPSYLQVLGALEPIQNRRDYEAMWRYLESLPAESESESWSPGDVCRLKILRIEMAFALHRDDTAGLIDSAVNCAEELEKRKVDTFDRFDVSLKLGSVLRNSPRADQAVQFLQHAIELNPQHPLPYLTLGWMASDKNDCRTTIPYFEKGLRLDPEDRRALTRLSACYQDENMTKEGRSYFEALLPLATSTRTLIRLFIVGHGDERKELEAQLRESAGSGDFYQSRDAYITALWLNRELGKHDEVNRLFRDWPRYAGDPDAMLDEKAYQGIIRALLANGSQVLALQYPPDPDWPVLHALSPFDHGVEFLSMRSVLTAGLDKQNISDSLEEDFLHLTPSGAQFFAQGLADKVLEMSSP